MPNFSVNDRYSNLGQGHRTIEARIAWHYKAYEREQSEVERKAYADAEAKANRRGLWVDAKPVPPWEWRTLTRASRAGASRPD